MHQWMTLFIYTLIYSMNKIYYMNVIIRNIHKVYNIIITKDNNFYKMQVYENLISKYYHRMLFVT